MQLSLCSSLMNVRPDSNSSGASLSAIEASWQRTNFHLLADLRDRMWAAEEVQLNLVVL